jgi:hypothetical protein
MAGMLRIDRGKRVERSAGRDELIDRIGAAGHARILHLIHAETVPQAIIAHTGQMRSAPPAAAKCDRYDTGPRATLGVDDLRARRRAAAPSPDAAADATLPRPLDALNHLQTPGEAARRPLQIDPAQAGTPEPRLGGSRPT